MKIILFTLLLALSCFTASSQPQIQMHESFKKDKELKDAILKNDLTPFYSNKVVFMFDTTEREVQLRELNSLLKSSLQIPRNGEIKKASETNNGYVQTFGIYKNDDALYYIRFTMNQITGMLEEVHVEKNN
jgi:hypothetical protein